MASKNCQRMPSSTFDHPARAHTTWPAHWSCFKARRSYRKVIHNGFSISIIEVTKNKK